MNWIKPFILFNESRDLKDMGKKEIERFLSHLAINRNVAVATQNQAFNTILFLYKQVLGMPVKDQIDIFAPKNRASYP